MLCPNCGFDNRGDAHYCGMCGARLARTCPTCSFANPQDYRFCIRCGQPLSSEVRTLPLPPVSHDESIGATESVPAPVTAEPLQAREEEAPRILLEGERRVATIILADVQGSTDLLQRVGTEAWVEIMNRVFQLLEHEIYRYGGKVDQFRGDGLVAFFGTTVANEDDPERAVLAALAMQRAIKHYAAELEAREGIPLALRVGVNTGEVIVANIGDGRRYSEDTAMGEAVAVAARMETAAEPGTVLVSENTYRLVETQFEWEYLGGITVKGIAHPINVYRPLAQRATVEMQDYDIASPLIGRRREFEQLRQCFEDLADGLGGIVMLTAERGMGKSVLLNEVRRDILRQRALYAEAHASEGNEGDTEFGPDERRSMSATQTPLEFQELRGRARSYEQSQPYAMWQDLLYNWLGVSHEQSKEHIRDRLRERCEYLWGERMAEYYPDLARFLYLQVEPQFAGQIQNLDADGLRQQFFLTLRGWVEALAQERPTVITFSDIHWADTTSLDLLQYCLPLCDYLDLLWLLVFRPDRDAPVWAFRYEVETEYPHRLTHITLPPLDEAQGQELIEHLIGPGVLPEETTRLILDKAEGNPYFIQELIRSLIEHGILERAEEGDAASDEARWRLSRTVTSISLPDSLQNLLLARIDRLPPEEQRILQIASVIGQVFWSHVLRIVADDPPHLKASLTALQRAQLIVERGRIPVLGLGVEYAFVSSLIRDAAYDSLLLNQRVAYHRRIAELLETLFKDEMPAQHLLRYYNTLAHHYHHANHPEKELTYTLLSAEQAKALYANVEAGKYYTQALRLIEAMQAKATDEQEANRLRRQHCEALLGRHRVFYLTGEFAAMRHDAEEMLPCVRQLPDAPDLLIDALLHQPGVGDMQRREEIEAAVPLAEEALALSRQIGDRRREMESLIAIVNQRLALGSPDWQAPAEEALALARELRDRNYEARLLIGLGGLYAFSDQPERSMEYLEAAAALAMSEGIEDRAIQLSLLNLLGLEFERSGDYYRLLVEYQEERLHASREIGHRPIESMALQACGRIRGIYLGDYPAGLNDLEDSCHILRDTPDVIYPMFHIAHIMIIQDRLETAQEVINTIHEIGEPVQDNPRVSLLLVEIMQQNALGQRSLIQHDLPAARRHFEAALADIEKVRQLVRAGQLTSQQYEMAALSKAVIARLGLAQAVVGQADLRKRHLAEALAASSQAYEIYQAFGFAQVVECVSEEVLFAHSQALVANDHSDLAVRLLRRAYDEMMRKHALIPPESHYRRTYLEQIPLHRDIRNAYASRVGSLLAEAGQHSPWDAAAGAIAAD